MKLQVSASALAILAGALAPLPARRRRDATRSAPALVRLIDEIDTACCADGAMVGDRLVAALKDAAAQSGLLTAEQRSPAMSGFAPLLGDKQTSDAAAP